VRLLKLLGGPTDLRLADACAELDVSQSTAHRLMAMLVFHNFSVQDPASHVYRAGPALIELGLATAATTHVRQTLTATMERVAQATGETVHVGVLEGADVRFVDVVESRPALRVSGRVVRVAPLHATSMGKAMLATMTDEQIMALLRGPELGAITPRTITKRDVLMREVRRTRARGYAVNHEESEAGGYFGRCRPHPS
jgi:DNA-binding IclR family transcriptional regulator